ncbi:hypothetical protein PybrP1_011900 [[Pythium] brassicae (nom. inval.)]|nr:hypothetical protein PybrP1_011900 [[Pythium] brassicae (nom. inval.)]
MSQAGFDEVEQLEEMEALLSTLIPAEAATERQKPGRVTRAGSKRNLSRDRMLKEIAELRVPFSTVTMSDRSSLSTARAHERRYLSFSLSFSQYDVFAATAKCNLMLKLKLVPGELDGRSKAECERRHLRATVEAQRAAPGSDVFEDAGLTQRGFAASTTHVTKARLLDSGEEAPFLELGVVETDPYEFDVMCRAVRQCLLHKTSMRHRVEFADVPSPERTRAVEVRTRAVRGDALVVLEKLCVTRHYAEKKRATTVMAGMNGAPFANGTLTCVHMEPKQQLKATVGDSRVSNPFAELVMDNFQSDFDELNEMIELLLELIAMAFVPALIPTDEDALAALDDVMVFIDGLDGPLDLDASEGDSGASSSFLRFLDEPNGGSAAAAPAKEATRKRNVHREKMKREMQYLRLRAAELEQQLAALRQGTAVVLSPEDKQLIDASWQRIATHQLEARRKSEAENARLKDVLQTHVELAKSLGQTLGKRVNPALIAEERLDEVIESSGLASVTSDRSRSCQSKTHTSADGVAIPYIELTDTTVGPFPTRLVAKAGWEAVLREFFQRSNSTVGPDNIWYAGNTVAARTRTKHTLTNRNSEVEYLNAKVVIRKYVDEDNRLVLVWRGFNQLDDSLDMYSDETGWTVVQSYSNAGSIVRTSFCPSAF